MDDPLKNNPTRTGGPLISLARRLQNKTGKLSLWIILASILLTVILIGLFYLYLPLGVDWRDTYQPSTLELLRGHSPYDIVPFVNPPWILLPLIPLAILPDKLGCAIWAVLSLYAYGYVAFKFGAKPLALLALIFSYPVLFDLFYGQIDALIILGFLMPPGIGIFFVLAKPQIGIGIAVFWAIEAWRKEQFRGLVKLLVPVSIAFLLSFILYGTWFLRARNSIPLTVNAALWPQAIPIGLALLVYAIRTRSKNISILSSPFLSPYMGPHSWAVALLGLLPNQIELIIASVGLWVAVVLKGGWL